MSEAGPSPRATFETARLRLARYRVEGHEARARASAHAAQVSAEALQVERVGVWMFSERMQRLTCTTLYSRSEHKHAAGQVLQVSPHYAQALSQRRAIASEHARSDPLTHELAATYLVPNDIFSVLDAAIFREGRAIGVVRHEHVSTPRAFLPRDLDFAASVADMMATIFEQSERLELEAALQEQMEYRKESQKMEALGRIACAVAHDFNNVLSALSFSSELAWAASDAKTAENVRGMVAFGQRLTQQLLQFGAQHSDSATCLCDLPTVLTSMLPMLETSVGPKVELSVVLRIAQVEAAIDRSHFEQIILNLCLNARDALPHRGKITLVVREPTPNDELSPEMVVFEVIDTGTGMDDATLARIFEPYFTTKSQGGGLGLATVHGIVRRANGVLRAASELGRGTTMMVALPRTFEPSA